MFKLIIYAFLVYLLYKFIFELVIPVSKATSQVKDRMREMQQMQEQQMQQQRYQQQAQERQYSQQTAPTARPAASKKDDDYIEFEEVKS